ncbi:hypothetical protein Syun_005863 [Stephania yunnanensis]|uniref:Uncharacterized protein n=1 Tax=Stephania yunnanensis TaxID=152371 RepID=A0AAP0KVL0_9MAGN
MSGMDFKASHISICNSRRELLLEIINTSSWKAWSLGHFHILKKINWSLFVSSPSGRNSRSLQRAMKREVREVREVVIDTTPVPPTSTNFNDLSEGNE